MRCYLRFQHISIGFVYQHETTAPHAKKSGLWKVDNIFIINTKFIFFIRPNYGNIMGAIKLFF